jgi:hypothetical protein
VGTSGLGVKENTRGLDDDIGTSLTPLDVLRSAPARRETELGRNKWQRCENFFDAGKE